jgi:NAD-dependent SIR2 family protein deacetylase
MRVTTSEIAGAESEPHAGVAINANDGSIARILGKRPVLWVGAGLSIAAGYPTTGALIDALVAAADDPIDTTRSFYEVVDAVVASVRAGRVRDVLQRLFQPARPPTSLHRALARLAKAGTFAAIVTTN